MRLSRQAQAYVHVCTICATLLCQIPVSAKTQLTQLSLSASFARCYRVSLFVSPCVNLQFCQQGTPRRPPQRGLVEDRSPVSKGMYLIPPSTHRHTGGYHSFRINRLTAVSAQPFALAVVCCT